MDGDDSDEMEMVDDMAVEEGVDPEEDEWENDDDDDDDD